jgi:large subunit ribosomal protein L6
MSRVGKMPVDVPAGVDVSISQDQITVKGGRGTLHQTIGSLVSIKNENGKLVFAPLADSAASDAMSGTLRALVANMVSGVSKGFEKRLSLVGVGFRAAAAGKTLNLQIGYSHPVSKEMPEGVTVATPTPTEIVLNGPDKQVVGQVAAEIRAFREPEPYKGKGIRYVGEVVVIKETKKK